MGFFRDLEDFAKGIVTTVGGIVDDVASAIARPLGVHPDVVKVAAAALGVYHSAGGFVTAAGEAVSEAAAADLIAAHGAEALAASNQMAAAAELAAATGTALPYAVDPAQLAATLAAEGNIAAATQIATTAGVSTAPIVDSLIASGQYDAAAQLTMATNPMELGFVNQKIGLAKTAADTATAFPVATSPLAPMSTYTAAELAALDAGLGGVSGAGAGANALAPGAAATGVNVANALSPEALAALDAGLGGVPASAAGTAALSPETLAALDAGLGGVPASAATGAGAGAGAAAGAAAAGAGAGALGANALVPLALAGTGVLGAITARNAAETQADAARYAADKAYQVYQEQKALQEPFRTAGISAQNQLLTLLGLPGGTQGAEFGRYARPFGMQDFQADPGYAFRLSEGMKALEASRAAKGGLLSGATGKALSRYGQDLASQEYGSAFNRYQTERVNRLQPLGALMGTGQAAAAGQAGYAGQYGTNVGNLATSGAAAQAAGQVGMTNALTGALNTYLNYSANQNMVNALQDAAVRRASMYGPAIPV